MRTSRSRFAVIIVALVTCSFNMSCPQTEADNERRSPNIAQVRTGGDKQVSYKALIQENIPTSSSYLTAAGKKMKIMLMTLKMNRVQRQEAAHRRHTGAVMSLLRGDVEIRNVPGVGIHDSETIWDLSVLLLGSGSGQMCCCLRSSYYYFIPHFHQMFRGI